MDGTGWSAEEIGGGGGDVATGRRRSADVGGGTVAVEVVIRVVLEV